MWRIIRQYFPFILGMTLIGFAFRAVVFYEELPLWLNALVGVASFGFLALIWAFFYYISAYLDKYLAYEEHLWARILVQVGVSLLFAYLFINTLFVLNYYVYHFAEIGKLMIVAGNLMWTLIVLTINGFFIGEHFFYRWKEALTRNLEIERNLAQMQLQNLQNQLNPHFLFNSLTTLNSLIYQDKERASTFLKQLAAMYRYVMQHNQETLVALADELAFIQHYLALLGTRFGDAFRYELSVPKAWAGRQVVPVTLQILIENAVKHNQMSSDAPLAVRVYTEGEFLCVQNPKRLKKAIAHSNKIGLQNLQKLYKATFPHANVQIEDTESHFTVKIPTKPTN